MRQLLLLLLAVAGYITAVSLGLDNLGHAPWFGWVTFAALAIGLYGSATDIKISELKKHAVLIILAVTVGVVAKALIIGALTFAMFGDPAFWVFGVLFAQIDPLSVAALQGSSHMSDRAKTILECWAVGDDPITTVLAPQAPVFVAWLTGAQLSGVELLGPGSTSYLRVFLFNALFVVAVCLVAWAAQRWVARNAETPVLGGSFILVQFVRSLMFGFAIIGLRIRPAWFMKFKDYIVLGALWAVTVLVGMMLAQGMDWQRGIGLGVATFAAHAFVSLFLTWKLPRLDRLYLAIAQQNGITAINLSLLFQMAYVHSVEVAAPALVTVNTINLLANSIVNWRVGLHPAA